MIDRMSVSRLARLARLRRRFLVAMGLPAIASALPIVAACTKDGSAPLVAVPLADGDAGAPLATSAPIEAGKPASTGTASVKTFHDPPEPVPPRWAHTTTNICPENVDAPDPPELPSPFDHCPKNVNGAQFSAKATRAQRADNPDACCYVSFHGMAVPGRALRAGASSTDAIVACDVARDDWSGDAITFDFTLPDFDRIELARAWRADAAFEHASVAAFARFSMDLMQLGAPADLVARAHAAALDEIEHARLCHAIAKAYDGRARGPAPVAALSRAHAPTFAELAVETFVDGCVGETIAAMSAREAARDAAAPVRAALLRIAEDEERHAELAFAALAWLVSSGGAPARRAVADALGATAVGAIDPHAIDRPAHGRLGGQRARRMRERALVAVIEPCTLALLRAARAAEDSASDVGVDRRA
jgi:hypothetical protein